MPTVELKAPKDKFRVVGVDTFDGTDWVKCDCDTLEEAREIAHDNGGVMLKYYVYDEKETNFIKPELISYNIYRIGVLYSTNVLSIAYTFQTKRSGLVSENS